MDDYLADVEKAAEAAAKIRNLATVYNPLVKDPSADIRQINELCEIIEAAAPKNDARDPGQRYAEALLLFKRSAVELVTNRAAGSSGPNNNDKQGLKIAHGILESHWSASGLTTDS